MYSILKDYVRGLGKDLWELVRFLIVVLAPVCIFLFGGSVFTVMLFIASLVLINFTRLDKRAKLIILLIDLIPAVLVLNNGNTYYIDVLVIAGIYAILGLGLNVVVGFTGMFNLGYVAFYLIGAYAYGLFASPQLGLAFNTDFFPVSGGWFWLFLLVGGILAAALGFLLSLPVRRIRGDYLAVASLGFAEILRLIANNLDKPINITNGPKGLSPIAPPEIFGIVLNKPIHFYFIVLVMFLIALVINNRLNNSKIGRALCAIREDTLAAGVMGIPVTKYKMMAFAIGAAFAGVMGVVFAARQTYVDPTTFIFMESITLLAIVILGGFGSIPGVISGALILSTLQTFLLKQLSLYLNQLSQAGVFYMPNQLDPAKYEKFVFGILLVVICIFRPQGLLPAKRDIGYLENYKHNRRGLRSFFSSSNRTKASSTK